MWETRLSPQIGIVIGVVGPACFARFLFSALQLVMPIFLEPIHAIAIHHHGTTVTGNAHECNVD